MSLDCSGIVPKNCIRDYVFPNKSKLASSKCKLVYVVLILKDNVEDYRSSFCVIMIREEAIELSKLIEGKGSCLIVNEVLNRSYTIIGFKYQQQVTCGWKPTVILKDGNLFFQLSNSRSSSQLKYSLIRTNLYDEYGKLLEKDVFVAYDIFYDSVNKRCYLSYYKDGENRKCYVDHEDIKVKDKSIYDSGFDYIPCTYYERGDVSVGEPIKNTLVQLVLNTGQEVEVAMLEENIKYMVSSFRPNEVIKIDKLPVVVVGYTVKGETTELADCYYDETGLHLITKNYPYDTKNLYRVTLEQGISIEFSSNSRLGESNIILFDNKAIQMESVERIGKVKFLGMDNSKYGEPLQRFNSVYILKINLTGKIMSVRISAIDYMLMENSNDNYIIIDNNIEKIDSYIIDAKIAKELNPNVTLDVVGGYNVLRFFPENK